MLSVGITTPVSSFSSIRRSSGNGVAISISATPGNTVFASSVNAKNRVRSRRSSQSISADTFWPAPFRLGGPLESWAPCPSSEGPSGGRLNSPKEIGVEWAVFLPGLRRTETCSRPDSRMICVPEDSWKFRTSNGDGTLPLAPTTNARRSEVFPVSFCPINTVSGSSGTSTDSKQRKFFMSIRLIMKSTLPVGEGDRCEAPLGCRFHAIPRPIHPTRDRRRRVPEQIARVLEGLRRGTGRSPHVAELQPLHAGAFA